MTMGRAGSPPSPADAPAHRQLAREVRVNTHWLNSRTRLFAAAAAMALSIVATTAAPGAGFAATGIEAQSASTYICPTNTCVTLPVTISRSSSTPVLGFSVTFQLSANLTLCSGTGSIGEGGFMSSGGSSTSFQVIDNGGGSYTADDVVLDNCGPTATSGTLFTVAVKSSDPG